MTPGKPMIATRTPKSRSSRSCCLCGHTYPRGHRIGLVDLGHGRHGWAHLHCIITTRKDAVTCS
jgi:hypothetical protein